MSPSNFIFETDEHNYMDLKQQVQEAQFVQPNRIKLIYHPVEVQGQCILLSISPIKFIPWRYFIFLMLNIFLGIPFLITFWYPEYKRKFYFDFVRTVPEATDFFIVNYDEQVSIVPKESKVFMKDEEKSSFHTYFVNRYMTYVLDENYEVRVSMYDYRDRIGHIVRSKRQERGLSDCQAHELKNSYGPGTMVIERPSCVDLLVKEILRPLYIFLIFSVSYWTFNQKYFYFAGVLFFISSFGLAINLYQMLQLNTKIFSMAYYAVPLNVLREGRVDTISSLYVVPGDIVFLKDPIKIPFEGIILEGSALINECALTGESVPVVKKADSFQRMANSSIPIDRSAFVFEGTTIIQVNDKKKMAKFQPYRQEYGVPACVVRTNFVTTKGQLIRIILFPKEQDNIFQKEGYKYLLFLFCLSVGTFIVLIILIHSYVETKDLVQKFFDLITITVPPALPVSMTFGIIYAVQRLQRKKIFCIAQNKVIVGGMIEFCCFDKTGTLTEDFMDFYSLVPADNGKFYPPVPNNEPSINRMLEKTVQFPFINGILTNMASNNSIIKIEKTDQLIGDPMEIKTFLFGRFTLNQSHTDPRVIFGFESQRGHNGIVFRRFEFDSDLQRMSVICKSSISKDGCEVYAKGSPEMMATIMRKDTVPDDYIEKLKLYASRGFRVLSIASKAIPESSVQTLTREQAERDLIFNGFEVFENKLKPETKGAIAAIKAAEIGCVMITGDNTLTGSNISYKCDISNKSKGMIICDFLNGKFIEEGFDFQEDDDATTDVSSKNQSPPGPDVVVDNTYQHNKGVEIELLMNGTSGANLNNAVQAVQSEAHIFMQGILRKAQQRKCQLCVTGRAFNEIFSGNITELSELEKSFMRTVSVFARTKPNDKAKIVMAFQHMDMKVSMCGDGANDCGALKQADIGLSLSQAEASISAPFTSQVPNITSMVEVMKECRAGLATNFSLFNILTIYSLIQYTTTVLTQKFLQYPADFQYLYWDLFLNFSFIVFIGYTNTAQKLSVQRPRSSLFCATNLFQMVFAFGIQLAGQISIIAIFQAANPDYYGTYGGMDVAKIAYDDNNSEFTYGLETCTLFIFVNNLYVLTMISFNIAKPWREYFFTNLPLMIMIIFTLAYNQILIFWKAGSFIELHAYDYLPDTQADGSTLPGDYSMRWIIFGASLGFGLVILILQKLIFEPLSIYLIKRYPEYKWL